MHEPRDEQPGAHSQAGRAEIGCHHGQSIGSGKTPHHEDDISSKLGDQRCLAEA